MKNAEGEDEAAAEEEEEEEKRLSVVLAVGMGFFIVLTAVVALLLAAPFEAAGVKAFENSESVWTPLYFLALVVGFTVVILVVLKLGDRGERLLYFLMLGAVAVTLYYVFAVLFPAPLDSLPLVSLPLVSTLAVCLLLYKFPEWYVLDATGLLIGGGAAAMFGISLGVASVVLLLVILAVYDAISVYKTKHMIVLAESIVEMRVPILFVLPRRRGFSLVRGGRGVKSHKSSRMDEAFLMGLGDAIIPTMLVVSANLMPAFARYWGLINAPALGALLGTLAGYGALVRIAGRGTPHAGLPFLNLGAILGFVVGLA